MKLREAYDLLHETFDQWLGDNTTTLGAALAYYAVFAFAPLAVLAVAIAGFLFGEDAARGELYERLQTSVGPTFAKAIQDTLQYTATRGGGTIATIISIVVILVGATGLFSQLQQSLNTIWGVQPKNGRTWWDMIKERLMSFVMVLLVSVLLLASLVSSTIIHALGGMIDLPGGPVLWRVVNWVVSFVLVTVVFALIYKVLPDVQISWRDVMVGATLTTVLFLIGNFLIGLYLSKSGTASAYGAAGSLVIILLWVYYSSQVLLFGAEFTQVYANHYGQPLVSETAEVLRGSPVASKKGLCRDAALPG